jgi:hypothetical protein
VSCWPSVPEAAYFSVCSLSGVFEGGGAGVSWRTHLLRWRVVSTYLDGERIREGVAFTKRGAQKQADEVREFRADQGEGPRVTVERRAA